MKPRYPPKVADKGRRFASGQLWVIARRENFTGKVAGIDQHLSPGFRTDFREWHPFSQTLGCCLGRLGLCRHIGVGIFDLGDAIIGKKFKVTGKLGLYPL